MRGAGLVVGLLLAGQVVWAQPACVPQVSTAPVFALRWTPPPPVAGATLAGYVLERRVETGDWLPWVRVAPSLSSVLDLVTPGTSVTYRVAAEYANLPGASVRSAWAADGSPPPCVTVLAPGIVLAAVRGCEGYCITLTWSMLTAPVMLERQVMPGPPGWQSLGTGQDGRYVDTEVSPRKRYGYHARTETSTWGPIVWVDSSTSQEGGD